MPVLNVHTCLVKYLLMCTLVLWGTFQCVHLFCEVPFNMHTSLLMYLLICTLVLWGIFQCAYLFCKVPFNLHTYFVNTLWGAHLFDEVLLNVHSFFVGYCSLKKIEPMVSLSWHLQNLKNIKNSHVKKLA